MSTRDGTSPSVRRPREPGLSGPWSGETAWAFLEASRIPVRLACNGSTGHPLIASLWFVPRQDEAGTVALWCATQRASTVARLLRADGRCAFEVAPESPAYRGVRGPAVATLHDELGREILQAALARYGVDPRSSFADWLLGRADQETAIAVHPLQVVSWDYRERMGDAGR